MEGTLNQLPAHPALPCTMPLGRLVLLGGVCCLHFRVGCLLCSLSQNIHGDCSGTSGWVSAFSSSLIPEGTCSFSSLLFLTRGCPLEEAVPDSLGRAGRTGRTYRVTARHTENWPGWEGWEDNYALMSLHVPSLDSLRDFLERVICILSWASGQVLTGHYSRHSCLPLGVGFFLTLDTLYNPTFRLILSYYRWFTTKL